MWRRIFEVNVFGTWSMTLAALPALREATGSVVNVASLAGLRPTGSSIPYAASKAALNHMTVLLAKVVGPERPGERGGARAHRHALDGRLGRRARRWWSRRPRSNGWAGPRTWPRSCWPWPGRPT